MNKVLFFVSLTLFAASCSSFHAVNTETEEKEAFNCIETRDVFNYSEIPDSLLKNLEIMGKDGSEELTSLEAEYLNYVFQLPSSEWNVSLKEGDLLNGKNEFFGNENSRYDKGEELGAGCCNIYFFNTSQKEECGGYDAAIFIWSKFIYPSESVVKMLKRESKRHNKNK